jgi:hypothetical protein
VSDDDKGVEGKLMAVPGIGWMGKSWVSVYR